MAHGSTPEFRCLHALRIKGFAGTDILAEVADVAEPEVTTYLTVWQSQELALYRENRNLWQLTSAGKEHHKIELAGDVTPHVVTGLKGDYQTFLALNETFKGICSDWQIYNGQPNDHMDDEYDDEVLGRLHVLHDKALPIVSSMASVLARLSPYSARLVGARQRLVDGNIKMLTGVMCNSYHDVWMELHEDLLLTQGIDRRTEGSF